MAPSSDVLPSADLLPPRLPAAQGQRVARGGLLRVMALLSPGIALPLLIGGMVALDRATQQQLNAALSESLGLSVRVGDVRPCLHPLGFSLHDVALGGAIDVGRIDVGVGWDSRSGRPRIRQVTLVRPSLVLGRLPSAGQIVQPQAATPEAPGIAPPAHHDGADSRPVLRIRQGRVEAQTVVAGRLLRLRVEELFVAPGGQGVRVVTGRVSVSDAQGQRLVVLAATAMDIDGASRRPTRFASLGGSVHAPGREAPLLRLHRVHATPRASGFALVVEGTPATDSDSGGSFRIEASLGPGGTPRDGVLTLNDLAMADLAPVLGHQGLRLDKTRLTGQLSFERPAQAWHLVADVRADGVAMENRLVARRPVGPTNLQIEAAVTVDPQLRRIVIDRSRFRVGAIQLHASAEASIDEAGARLSASLKAPRLRCQALLDSVPEGFAPTLAGMKLSGSIGLHVRLRLNTRQLDRGSVHVALAPMSCRVRKDPPAADVAALRAEPTVRVRGAKGVEVPWVLGPANSHYRRLDQISRYARGAFVAAEDTHFFVHHGFDEEQLRRAFLHNLQVGRFARGASTISQQLVKNVFLRHDRTLSRKFEEIALTWRMEQVIPKARILEAYLNIVEMGPGIYGVQQAAQHYFGVSAADLNPLQAVHLAALTPSPRPLAKRFKHRDPGPDWQERLRLLLRLMRRRGNIDQRQQRRWANEHIALLHR